MDNRAHLQRPASYKLVPDEREQYARSCKPLPRSIRPFKVKALHDEVTTINKDGVRYRVAIDRATMTEPQCAKHSPDRKRRRAHKSTPTDADTHDSQ